MEERDCKHCKNYKWVEEETHGGRPIGGFWSCCKWDCKFEKNEIIQAIKNYVKNLPPVNPQEPKILETLDFAIDASNGDTNYFVGFRNGLRYAKSLIDGEEPQFESCVEKESKESEVSE